MRRVTSIAILLFAILSQASLSAQSLPKLKQAEEVSTGVFPCGIEYCLATNDARPGRADFALVQNGRFDVDATRELFYDLEHLNPASFLSRHRIPYGEDGYVSYYPNARVFHFQDVDVKNREVADSTVLMLLDLMALSRGSQTVIVCGDIDKEATRTMLRTFSMTLPKVSEPILESSAGNEISIVRNSTAPGLISLSFRLATVPHEQAGTPVPLVTELFARELGQIFTERVQRELNWAAIPCYIQVSPARFDVHVPIDKDEDASKIIRGIIADIRGGGVSSEEFQWAKKLSLPEIASSGLRKGKSNSYYVERCVSYVLTGSNLASEETIKSFFSKRRISEKRELSLFNNFVCALIPEIPQDPDHVHRPVVYPELEPVLRAQKTKTVKISATTSDPVTGGSLWTWSNGMRVLYKYVKDTDGFDFCLAQRGGSSCVEDISYGESSALSDFLRISRIAGVPGDSFHKMLKVEGITLEEDISIKGMRISGHAPVDKMETVLKSLLKLGYEREIDQRAVEAYLRNRRLRESVELPSVRSVVDSLICPDYMFRSDASVANLRDDLPQRAENYFQERFDNLTDGVLIIIGAVPEAKASELLSKYLGGFHTSRLFALRNRVPYSLDSGRSTYTAQGDQESVNLASTAKMAVTLENYLTFRLAVETVRRQFSGALFNIGLQSEVEGSVDMLPEDLFSIYISCRPCLQDGLPEGVIAAEPTQALKTVRETLEKSKFVKMNDAEFKDLKNSIQSQIAKELSTSEGMMRYALWRYSEGKDLCSGYSGAMKNIVVDDIRWMLDEIVSSGVVEYVVE